MISLSVFNDDVADSRIMYLLLCFSHILKLNCIFIAKIQFFYG